ncbi:hypothetical protein [Mesorhizobium sp. SP-1A]|nr:hypothetical protein [Mesorhizobium sp. SP-1A]
MGNVVKMQVFLVGDPSRSVVQVAGLASPGFLVEIEVTAVRP